MFYGLIIMVVVVVIVLVVHVPILYVVLVVTIFLYYVLFRCNDSISSTSSDDGQARDVKLKPRYYFQPSVVTQSTMKPHAKIIQTPLPGQLLSMAIPLGKPKTDPSLRLPVNINERMSC